MRLTLRLTERRTVHRAAYDDSVYTGRTGRTLGNLTQGTTAPCSDNNDCAADPLAGLRIPAEHRRAVHQPAQAVARPGHTNRPARHRLPDRTPPRRHPHPDPTLTKETEPRADLRVGKAQAIPTVYAAR